jgi:hypothetical protein
MMQDEVVSREEKEVIRTKERRKEERRKNEGR